MLLNPSRLTLIGLVLSALGGLFAGCGHANSVASDTPCWTNSDCSSSQTCHLPAAPAPREMDGAALPCYDLCASDAECGEGLICEQTLLGGCVMRQCVTGCTETSCLADEVCGDAGRCQLMACDEPDAAACPEHWRCDPEQAPAEPTGVLGSSVGDADAQRSIDRGCVRLRCDEDGGFACRQGWQCDPDSAVDGSGCVALPCEEAGGCSNDASFVCEPTSDNPRPDGVDPHGCVGRNCEEGRECSYLLNGVNAGRCRPDAPDADSAGCVRVGCDELEELCPASMVCDVDSSLANDFGCRLRTCQEGVDCRAGFRCDPNSAAADIQGCVVDNATSAGTSTSTSTSTSGGSSGMGRCVAR